jgi:TonB family protein
MRQALKTVSVGLMSFGLAAASPAPPPGFTPPKWLHRPRAEEIAAVWPTKAMARGAGGKATIHCKVNTAGVLFDCTVVDEFPAGEGFGHAAIMVSSQFQLSPALQDGVPVVFDGVTIPIEFARPDAPTATRLRGDSSLRAKGDPLLAEPEWRAVPTVAEVAAAYPPKAAAAKQPGRALVRCGFDAQGHTNACDTVLEEPVGAGFGMAARRLARQFSGPLTFGEGRPIQEALTQIQFTFTTDLLASPLTSPRPNWIALPEAAALANAFPAKARAAGLKSSRVVLGCVAGATGGLEACELQSEDQPGFGFGQAAMALVPAFRLKTWSDDGRPMVGGRVRIPLRFEDDEAPAAKP